MSDKAQHIIAFATLALLASLAYPAAKPAHLLFSLVAFGGVIELLQMIPALNRDSDLLDLVADTLAAGGMLLFATWWRRRAQPRLP